MTKVKARSQRAFRINARSKLHTADSTANEAVFRQEKLLVAEKRWKKIVRINLYAREMEKTNGFCLYQG